MTTTLNKLIKVKEKEIDKKISIWKPQIAQNRNGIEYCSTCKQDWENCSCSARNSGRKKAIEEILPILSQSIKAGYELAIRDVLEKQASVTYTKDNGIGLAVPCGEIYKLQSLLKGKIYNKEGFEL